MNATFLILNSCRYQPIYQRNSPWLTFQPLQAIASCTAVPSQIIGAYATHGQYLHGIVQRNIGKTFGQHEASSR